MTICNFFHSRDDINNTKISNSFIQSINQSIVSSRGRLAAGGRPFCTTRECVQKDQGPCTRLYKQREIPMGPKGERRAFEEGTQIHVYELD